MKDCPDCEKLRAALREARCWIVDGSRRTPEQRGAQCQTCFDALEMIDKTLADPQQAATHEK